MKSATKSRQAKLLYRNKGHLLQTGLLRFIAIGQNTHGLQEREQKSKAQRDICELSRI